MFRLLLPSAALLLALSAPTLAAPFCTDDGPGLHISTGLSFGGKFTDEERNDFDQMNLRRMGIDVTRVERWNGCIRAFVTKPTGGEEMQFFHPRSYKRVY
jgi:hypothetical protein